MGGSFITYIRTRGESFKTHIRTMDDSFKTLTRKKKNWREFQNT